MIDRVSIPCGELTLEGLLERPDGAAPWGGAVVCHPHPLYGGNMHNNVVARLAPALAQDGLAALRFNFRGVGRSQGQFADGVGEQEDVRAALAHLAGVDGLAGKPLVVLGYSFGAAVASRAVCEAPDVAALVCIALPVGFGAFDFEYLRGCAPFPKLFLAGSADDICPVPKVRELVASLPEPKSLVVLDATDHFFHGREPELASHVTAFLEGLRPAA